MASHSPLLPAVKVLVVDDSTAVRRRVAALVAEGGPVEVVEAPDVTTALRAAAASAPDVVVLDLHLPDGSGFDVLSRVKQRPAPPLAIVMTNHVSEAYRRHASVCGAEHFLDKSSDFRKIPRIIAGLVLRRRRA